MRHFIILISVFISTSIWGQSNKCDCGGLLDINNLSKISILKNPEGNHKYYIQNDAKNEIYVSFQILEQKENFFKVIPIAMDKVLDTGWINGLYLKIFARNYSTKLLLYSNPSKTSKPISVINKYLPDTYKILKCDGKWLYVKLKSYKGWMKPEMQCDNPYSTCN